MAAAKHLQAACSELCRSARHPQRAAVTIHAKGIPRWKSPWRRRLAACCGASFRPLFHGISHMEQRQNSSQAAWFYRRRRPHHSPICEVQFGSSQWLNGVVCPIAIFSRTSSSQRGCPYDHLHSSCARVAAESAAWGVGTPLARSLVKNSWPGGYYVCPGLCLKVVAPCATCRVPNTRLAAGAPLQSRGRRWTITTKPKLDKTHGA